jgi:hypothetical protein
MALARLSRRAWLTVTGGTLVAAGSAAVLWKSGRPGAARGSTGAGAPASYVDHDGWMLTPADKQRLELTSPPAVQSP